MLCSGASDNPGICFSLEFEIKLENYIDQAIRWHEQVQACPYVVEVEK